MSKGYLRGLARGPKSRAPIVKQVVRVKDLALQADGATGVGFGAAVPGDLPAGNILFLGAVSYLQFSTAAAGVQAAFDGDYSIGSTPTADATLSGTDANIVGSSALGAATAKVSPIARGTGATAVILDNTDDSLELNINLLIDDANISADDVDFLVNGYIVLSYIVLGDD